VDPQVNVVTAAKDASVDYNITADIAGLTGRKVLRRVDAAEKSETCDGKTPFCNPTLPKWIAHDRKVASFCLRMKCFVKATARREHHITKVCRTTDRAVLPHLLGFRQFGGHAEDPGPQS
jgi:hypothetical protein